YLELQEYTNSKSSTKVLILKLKQYIITQTEFPKTPLQLQNSKEQQRHKYDHLPNEAYKQNEPNDLKLTTVCYLVA
ncbi:hypothetical protein ACUX4R_28645, partial [Salmonella enterica]